VDASPVPPPARRDRAAAAAVPRMREAVNLQSHSAAQLPVASRLNGAQ